MIANSAIPPPVAIGGVGGSGTRLVAELVREAGFHMGTDLNAPSDTLWFTLLFKRIDILDCGDREFDDLVVALTAGLGQGAPLAPATESLVRTLAEADRTQHPATWLALRADSLVEAARAPSHGTAWGWKEPNTHVVIERLWQRLPQLRYVHVVRNGVDMAYSSNQNQLALWGPRVLGEDGPPTPRRSLAYWCAVHRRMQRLLAENPDRMYWLDYDALCREPQAGITKLFAFMGCGPAAERDFAERVRAPSKRDSVDLGDFSPGDLDYVRSLGYVS